MKMEKRNVDKNLHDLHELTTCAVAPGHELSHVTVLSKIESDLIYIQLLSLSPSHLQITSSPPF